MKLKFKITYQGQTATFVGELDDETCLDETWPEGKLFNQDLLFNNFMENYLFEILEKEE